MPATTSGIFCGYIENQALAVGSWKTLFGITAGADKNVFLDAVLIAADDVSGIRIEVAIGKTTGTFGGTSQTPGSPSGGDYVFSGTLEVMGGDVTLSPIYLLDLFYTGSRYSLRLPVSNFYIAPGEKLAVKAKQLAGSAVNLYGSVLFSE
jgi:hypothetical protein